MLPVLEGVTLLSLQFVGAISLEPNHVRQDRSNIDFKVLFMVVEVFKQLESLDGTILLRSANWWRWLTQVSHIAPQTKPVSGDCPTTPVTDQLRL